MPRAKGAPRFGIERLIVPNGGAWDARAGLIADLRGFGTEGRPYEFTWRTDGALIHTVSATGGPSDGKMMRSVTSFPASRHDPMLLRFEARVAGGPPAIAEVAYAPGIRQWRVLFHDTRASWASTFVRRAVERDPQFMVSSRIAATRGVASGANAPARLTDRAAMEQLDLVVVGAPHLLAGEEIAALEWFVRERGGSLVLLLDETVPAPVVDRLAGSGAWSSRTGGDPLVMSRADAMGESLRAIEITWPSRLPIGADPIAFTNVASRADSARHPVIWGMPVGAGHVVVSGALDAWRFRDASQSSFDMLWRGLLSEEAARAVPPVDVHLSRSVVAPGEYVTATVRVRSGTQSAAGAAAALRDAKGARSAVRVWPAEAMGMFRAAFRAPTAPGAYELSVSRGIASGGAPLVVSADPRPARATAREALAAVATSSGGSVLDEGAMVDAIEAALNPAESPEPWHPMRSGWWIVPFALLLSAEWWMRRRRGHG